MAGESSIDRPSSLPALLFVSEPPGAESAVAFIHGLGGDCLDTWGPKGQPATFIKRLSADLPGSAIATYGYVSGPKRAFRASRLKVENLVRVWATKLRDSLLTRYGAVAVICHSLGGMVTMGACRHLFTTQHELARRLQVSETRLALFLMGVPQEGTNTRGADWLSSELQALTYNGELARLNMDFWLNRVRPPGELGSPSDLPIDTFAVVSETDRWVPQVAAGAGLREGRVHRTALSHTAMVKPPAAGHSGPYDFVLRLLTALLANVAEQRG